jgi:peptide/nickel transport system ATP-binding protein
VKALLQVRNLNVSYFLGETRIVGVEGVNLEIGDGEILGLVGESGSGKSTLAISIIRALKPPGKVTSGSILFQDKELLKLGDDELRSVRWKEISMVPQASQNALSPTMRVRDHFKSVMMAHGVHDQKTIHETSTRYLIEVMLEPHRVMDAFPHELSGGMKQRVLIALLRPRPHHSADDS